MKYFLSIFTALVLIFSGVQTGAAAQLVYKYSRDFKSGTLVDFTDFDATNYGQIRIAIKRKPEISDSTDSADFAVAIYTFDVEDELFIASGEATTSYTTLIDSPPSKIRIKLKGSGNFRIYVWASR